MSLERYFIYPPKMYEVDMEVFNEKFIELLRLFKNPEQNILKIAKRYQPHLQVFQAYTGSCAQDYQHELAIINKLQNFFSGSEPAPLTIANGKAAATALDTIYKTDARNVELVKQLLDDQIDRLLLNKKIVNEIKKFLPALDYCVDDQADSNADVSVFNDAENNSLPLIFTLLATAIESNTAVKSQDKFRILNILATLDTQEALLDYLEKADANDKQFLFYVIYTFVQTYQANIENRIDFSIAKTETPSPTSAVSANSCASETSLNYEILNLKVTDAEDQIYYDEQDVVPQIVDWRNASHPKRVAIYNLGTATPLSSQSVNETFPEMKSPLKTPRITLSLADELRDVDEIAENVRKQIIAKLQHYIKSRGSVDSEGYIKTNFLTKCFRDTKLTMAKLELTQQLIKDITSNAGQRFIEDKLAAFIKDNEKVEGRFGKTYGCCTQSGLIKTAGDIKGLLASSSLRNFAARN